MMDAKIKKMACFLPGLGTPISLYYVATNKELKSAALKGLAILPIALLVVTMTPLVPSAIALLAAAYLYWGIISLAAGWGFLTMLIGMRVIKGTNAPVAMEVENPEIEIPELIPRASVSEIIPDMDPSEILSGIERLSEEKKKTVVSQIVQRAKTEEEEFLKRYS